MKIRNPKTVVLVTTALLFLLGLTAAHSQADETQRVEDSQQLESPPISLADLDALLEEEEDASEEIGAVLREQLFDLLALSGFLALARPRLRGGPRRDAGSKGSGQLPLAAVRHHRCL